ncbi:hypothetical protein PP707_00995 [Acetobacter pasteurianus]|nr:hypothetical protein [Acetobacter pasteurianus]
MLPTTCTTTTNNNIIIIINTTDFFSRVFYFFFSPLVFRQHCQMPKLPLLVTVNAASDVQQSLVSTEAREISYIIYCSSVL